MTKVTFTSISLQRNGFVKAGNFLVDQTRKGGFSHTMVDAQLETRGVVAMTIDDQLVWISRLGAKTHSHSLHQKMDFMPNYTPGAGGKRSDDQVRADAILQALKSGKSVEIYFRAMKFKPASKVDKLYNNMLATVNVPMVGRK